MEGRTKFKEVETKAKDTPDVINSDIDLKFDKDQMKYIINNLKIISKEIETKGDVIDSIRDLDSFFTDEINESLNNNDLYYISSVNIYSNPMTVSLSINNYASGVYININSLNKIKTKDFATYRGIMYFLYHILSTIFDIEEGDFSKLYVQEYTALNDFKGDLKKCKSAIRKIKNKDLKKRMLEFIKDYEESRWSFNFHPRLYNNGGKNESIFQKDEEEMESLLETYDEYETFRYDTYLMFEQTIDYTHSQLNIIMNYVNEAENV